MRCNFVEQRDIGLIHAHIFGGDIAPAEAVDGTRKRVHVPERQYPLARGHGVFQKEQMPGDVIIATGTFRAGGTANAYLPLAFPAVPTFEVLRELVQAAEKLELPYMTGVGIAGDAFYSPSNSPDREMLVNANVVSIEMESDALFIIGQYRNWRTGAIYTSDGTPNEIKPEWGMEQYKRGEGHCIQIALQGMLALAEKDDR
mgnify:CR=1 FL=1